MYALVKALHSNTCICLWKLCQVHCICLLESCTGQQCIVQCSAGALLPPEQHKPRNTSILAYCAQVPLDAVDLQHVSLLYTQGEMAAVAPIYDYDFRMLTEMVSEASWRQLLFWLGPPGLLIGALALLTLKEPRTANAEKKKGGLGSRIRLPFMSGVPPEPSQSET